MKLTLAEAIRITPEARIVTTATYPYTIVHTNRAWSEMTGYRFTEVVRADGFPWLSMALASLEATNELDQPCPL